MTRIALREMKEKMTTKTVARKRSGTLMTAKHGLAGRLQTSTGALSTAEIISSLKNDFGVSQSLLVHLSGYSPRSIVSWAKGTRATKPAKVKFVELNRLFEALADLTQDRDEVVAWLEEPNEAFDGSTPLQVIERGEADRIWRMIYFLRSGEPS